MCSDPSKHCTMRPNVYPYGGAAPHRVRGYELCDCCLAHRENVMRSDGLRVPTSVVRTTNVSRAHVCGADWSPSRRMTPQL